MSTTRREARTGGAELGLGVVGERSGARAVGGVECLAQAALALRCVDCAAGAWRRGQRGARSSNLRVAALERVDRLTEQDAPRSPPATTPAARSATPSRTRGAERPGELELLFCQAFCRLVIAERELGERGLRSPGKVARAGDRRSRQGVPTARKSSSPSATRPCCDPQPAAGEAKTCGDHRSALCIRSRAARAPPRPRRGSPCSTSVLTSRPPFMTRYMGGAGSLVAASAVRASPSAAPEVAASEREPAAVSQADRKPTAVAGRAGLRDRGIEQRPHAGRTARPKAARTSPGENQVANENHGLPSRPPGALLSGQKRPARKLRADLRPARS